MKGEGEGRGRRAGGGGRGERSERERKVESGRLKIQRHCTLWFKTWRTDMMEWSQSRRI